MVALAQHPRSLTRDVEDYEKWLGIHRSAEAVRTRTIVTPNERITVCSSMLSIDKFLTFLESNIHVSINRLKLAFVDDTRVQLHSHRDADDR